MASFDENLMAAKVLMFGFPLLGISKSEHQSFDKTQMTRATCVYMYIYIEMYAKFHSSTENASNSQNEGYVKNLK